MLTVAVVHLALLTWETRHVSLTLGAPGLKPGRADKPGYRTVGEVSRCLCSAAFVFPPIDELFRWKDIWFKDTPFAINKTVILIVLVVVVR